MSARSLAAGNATRIRIPCALICLLAAAVPTQSKLASSAPGPAVRKPGFTAAGGDDRTIWFDHISSAFGQQYLTHLANNGERSLCDGMSIYYLRRELQALVDMWRATDERSYLDCARDLTLQAMNEATDNPRPLIWHDDSRGDWPCFYLATVETETGGHNQLCDFQGAVGFLIVARALQLVEDPAAQQIREFVEDQIVEKWLDYKPSITPWHLTNPNSFKNILALLNTGRDVREHFACICLDLHKLGSVRYEYRNWAKHLIDLYLTVRYDLDAPAPNSERIADLVPANWGLLPRVTTTGDPWLFIPTYDTSHVDTAIDTSHANRTAWLAARAYSEGLLEESTLDGLINTLELRIWAPEKGLFYFNNYADGSDGELDGLAPGRGGNVWFGWHRLAEYDQELEALFIALAFDLTMGGPNIPAGAQNKTMANAPLCLEAWAARLLSVSGQAHSFP